MASTSMSLGKHWEDFIKSEVASGAYGSATEVVREALRHFEQKKAAEAWLEADIKAALNSGDVGSVTADDIAADVKALKAKSNKDAA